MRIFLIVLVIAKEVWSAGVCTAFASHQMENMSRLLEVQRCTFMTLVQPDKSGEHEPQFYRLRRTADWNAYSVLNIYEASAQRTSRVWSVCFSPDGKHLATGGYDRIVQV